MVPTLSPPANMNEYRVSSRAYLLRARQRLVNQSAESLFYAAYELRCGIESRMNEYLEVWEHIAASRKNGWRIPAIAQNIEKAFTSSVKIVRWAIYNEKRDALSICFYYTPVTQSLQKKGQKLGDYLHSSKMFRPPSDPWWSAARTELQEIERELTISNTGTMLGPPLMRPGTGEAKMNVEILPGHESEELISALPKGATVHAKVDYLDSLPNPIESEAYIWRTVS